MDFFITTDWLNRPAPYAFKLDHILFVLIGLAIGVFLAFFLIKKNKKTIKTVLISLWAFGTLTELIYYSITYILCIIDPFTHPFSLEGMLPFHSCLMFMYVFPFAMFSKNKVIKKMANNFLVVINMIIGFITLFVGCPPAGHSALSFDGIQSMIIHVIIVITPFIMIVTRYYDIRKSDLKYGLLLFAILSIVMWTFDAITGCDYFFFYDGHTFPVFSFISDNVPNIVWTLIVVTCYTLTAIIIHHLIILIKDSKKIKIVGENYSGYSNQTRIGCRAIIIKDNKILLSYEANNDQWELPGGGLEIDEKNKECVIREAKEETGYIVNAKEKVLEIDEFYEDVKYVSRYFICEIISEDEKELTEAEKEEGLEPRWLPINEIIDIFSKHEDYSNEQEMKRGMYLREYTALKEILHYES